MLVAGVVLGVVVCAAVGVVVILPMLASPAQQPVDGNDSSPPVATNGPDSAGGGDSPVANDSETEKSEALGRTLPTGLEDCVRSAAENAGRLTKAGWKTRAEDLWAGVKPELRALVDLEFDKAGLSRTDDIPDTLLWSMVGMGAMRVNSNTDDIGRYVAYGRNDWLRVASRLILLYARYGAEFAADAVKQKQNVEDLER
jgi:hypothetical protein